jgi:hypothetical protein
MRAVTNSHRIFTRLRPTQTSYGAEEAPFMSDILVIVFGTGAILLMAAYAVLCERI